MMNGIKEDIKTLLTLELGSPLFHEVVVNLSVRLKALQVQSLLSNNCIGCSLSANCALLAKPFYFRIVLGFLVVEACISYERHA
jgi:hypothetical protein